MRTLRTILVFTLLVVISLHALGWSTRHLGDGIAAVIEGDSGEPPWGPLKALLKWALLIVPLLLCQILALICGLLLTIPVPWVPVTGLLAFGACGTHVMVVLKARKDAQQRREAMEAAAALRREAEERQRERQRLHDLQQQYEDQAQALLVARLRDKACASLPSLSAYLHSCTHFRWSRAPGAPEYTGGPIYLVGIFYWPIPKKVFGVLAERVPARFLPESRDAQNYGMIYTRLVEGEALFTFGESLRFPNGDCGLRIEFWQTQNGTLDECTGSSSSVRLL